MMGYLFINILSQTVIHHMNIRAVKPLLLQGQWECHECSTVATIEVSQIDQTIFPREKSMKLCNRLICLERQVKNDLQDNHSVLLRNLQPRHNQESAGV